jgi:hypothetical protein
VADETLVDRLEQEIKAHYLARMGTPDASADLRGVLTDYLNWQFRQIPVEPRAVHRSDELIASPKAVEHRDLLEGLIAKIVRGDDLTPHLSRSAHAVGRHDSMLSDWGLQHLHFRPEGGMDDLLFAVLDPGHAYLIGIYPHRTSWALQEVAEIVVRNWPDSGIFSATHYVVGLTQQWNDEERGALRRAHISTSTVEVDGKVYAPRVIGQMGDGGSMAAARGSMAFMAELNLLRWNLEERLAGIRDAGERAAGRSLPGAWEPATHEGRFGLLQDGVFVGIGDLP